MVNEKESNYNTYFHMLRGELLEEGEKKKKTHKTHYKASD